MTRENEPLQGLFRQTMNITVSSKRQQTLGDKTMCVSAFVALLLVAGCQDRSHVASTPLPSLPAGIPVAQPAAIRTADQWLGQWNGPEGTTLRLSRVGNGYAVRIQSLDGPATYTGKAISDGIEFVRDGRTESIRASDGEATGMKWLAEKNDCLTIRVGEGFCRD